MIAERPRTTIDATPTAKRIDWLDGVRGLALVAVLACHINAAYAWNNATLRYGNSGVALFLMVSGFILYWQYAGGKAVNVKSFAARRFRRIWPPYMAAVLLYAGIAWSNGDHAYIVRWVALHALLVHNLNTHYVNTIDGPLWSMGLECQLYVMFPLAVLAFRKFGIVATVWGFYLTRKAYLWWVLTRLHPINAPQDILVFHLCVPVMAIIFVLGMAIAHRLYAMQTTGQTITRAEAYSLLAMLVVDPIWRAVITGAIDAQIVSCAIFVVIIGSAGTFAKSLFSWRPLKLIGFVSYSIYLTHQPLMNWAAGHTAPIVDLLITILAGCAFFAVFERPWLNRPQSEAAKLTTPAKVSLTI